MKEKLIPVPKNCSKYYESCTLEDVVASGLGTKDEVEALEYFIELSLKATDSKFLGWAKCKQKYAKLLADAGLGLVQIAQGDLNNKYLVDVNGSGINIVSRELLDQICNQN